MQWLIAHMGALVAKPNRSGADETSSQYVTRSVTQVNILKRSELLILGCRLAIIGGMTSGDFAGNAASAGFAERRHVDFCLVASALCP